jgi:hypothetical protein
LKQILILLAASSFLSSCGSNTPTQPSTNRSTTTTTTPSSSRICSAGNIAFAMPGASGYISTYNASAAGGAVHLFVLTEPWMSCSWSVEPADSWVSLDFPAVGQLVPGDGDLHFSVQPNPSSAARLTAMRVGGRQLTIAQAGRQ